MNWLAIGLIGVMAVGAAQAQSVRVYAAGSLRAPLAEAAQAFEAANAGVKVDLVFGASGLLRDRIAAGEVADVFASANMEHPRSLASKAQWLPARAFTRNALCALFRKELDLTEQNFTSRLLDPSVKVGTSTPKADPSGDYAFEMFARIAAVPSMPADTRQKLEAKALTLTGGPNSPRPPEGQNVYAVLISEGQADVFITYCTNAALAMAQQPGLRSIQVPASINVGADYGLTVRSDASAASAGFAALLTTAMGQATLARHGFLPVAP